MIRRPHRLNGLEHISGSARALPLARVACFLATLMIFAAPLRSQFSNCEGYGYATRGGAGGDIYHVTTLADGGPGSLRAGIVNRSGPRTIVFDVAGVLTVTNSLAINRPYLTIDGATAPAPGITITKDIDMRQLSIAGTHDIIVRHIRFQGLYPHGAVPGTSGTEFFSIDGDANPDHIARNIVIDHVTVANASDAGLDIWGEVSDVTVSWCLIANSFHPSTVSFYPAPFQRRRRISMHHNVYARNGERNPQLRADVADFDYVNNIIYDWGYGLGSGYGIRIKNDASEPKVNANFINNYFLAGSASPAWGLVYGTEPGPDADDAGPAATPSQGTVITNSAMGKLWVAGNILPASNKDHYSTVPARNPVPTNAQVTTYSALELRDRVVPGVGMKYRSTNEQAMLSEMAGRTQSSAQLKILSVTPRLCVLELKAPIGFRNELQFSDSVEPPVWESLTNFISTGDLIDILDTPTEAGSRFYRVITTDSEQSAEVDR